MSKKIYDKSLGYSSLRWWTDAFIRGSYRRVRFLGMDRIPTDGAVIYAPNHCDALMDPLAVLAMSRRRKVFVARADVFKNPKVARILHFFKIMPINRRRDGLKNMHKAEETIEKSIEVLANGCHFCIMPEGTHRPMHALLPIGKGVARIALGTYRATGGDRPIYIVPVGLEYGDYFRFRGTLLAQIGEPIDATALIAAHSEMNDHDLMQEIRAQLTEKLAETITCVRDEANYDAIWELAKVSSGKIPALRMKRRLEANRSAIGRIEKFGAEQPEAAAALYREALDFRDTRRKARISLNSLCKKRPALAALWNTLLCLLTLPVFAVMAIASLPVWWVGETLAGRIKDLAFRNTARMGTSLILWTLLYIIETVLLFCFLPWYWALAAALVLLPAPMFTYDFFELWRMTASHWRTASSRNAAVRKQYDNLKTKIDNL